MLNVEQVSFANGAAQKPQTREIPRAEKKNTGFLDELLRVAAEMDIADMHSEGERCSGKVEQCNVMSLKRKGNEG